MGPEIQIEAFNQWQSAYGQLQSAVYIFHLACDTLHIAFLEQVGHSKSFASIGSRLAQVIEERGSLSHLEGKILESRTMLCRTMSSPNSLVPINSLPAEVLSHIMILVSALCLCLAEYDRNVSLRIHPLAAIPLVCTHWRRLAIDTKSLWAHIDIEEAVISGGSGASLINRAILWQGWAHDIPVHLHFLFLRGYSGKGEFDEQLLLRVLMKATSFTFFCSAEAHFLKFLSMGYYCNYFAKLKTIRLEALYYHFSSGYDEYWLRNIPKSLTTLELVDIPRRLAPTSIEWVEFFSGNRCLRHLRLHNVTINRG
ncbi:F-box-like protein [Ceratobasidium sp. AG-Ba]|nr:F-box-like protein [Ceratobasidium sp. AG-Ba]